MSVVYGSQQIIIIAFLHILVFYTPKPYYNYRGLLLGFRVGVEGVEGLRAKIPGCLVIRYREPCHEACFKGSVKGPCAYMAYTSSSK